LHDHIFSELRSLCRFLFLLTKLYSLLLMTTLVRSTVAGPSPSQRTELSAQSSATRDQVAVEASLGVVKEVLRSGLYVIAYLR
jgi:hypothetical protein